jgi:hypothetical protein
VAAIVADRAHPGRADALLGALVRLGAVDGGNDQDAAGAVVLLLSNGAARLAGQLRNLSGDIDQIVAGQVWLQIREFPWRRRREAIAANILMDARRALLRDLGVDTRRRRGRGDSGGHHRRGGHRQRLARPCRPRHPGSGTSSPWLSSWRGPPKSSRGRWMTCRDPRLRPRPGCRRRTPWCPWARSAGNPWHRIHPPAARPAGCGCRRSARPGPCPNLG